jgi:hypothetical protein
MPLGAPFLLIIVVRPGSRFPGFLPSILHFSGEWGKLHLSLTQGGVGEYDQPQLPNASYGRIPGKLPVLDGFGFRAHY